MVPINPNGSYQPQWFLSNPISPFLQPQWLLPSMDPLIIPINPLPITTNSFSRGCHLLLTKLVENYLMLILSSWPFLAHASMASWPDGLAMLEDGAYDIPLWPLAHQGAHGWLEVLIGLQLIDLTELMQQPMPESSVGQAKSKLNNHIFK